MSMADLNSRKESAASLYDRGRFRDAELMYQYILKQQEELLGEAEDDILDSLNNLASCLLSQGKLEQAEPIHRDVLRRACEMFGDTHSKTFACRNNLASCLSRRGHVLEAEQIYRDVVKRSVEVLGEADAGTLIAVTNLAVCLTEQGKWQDAEPMLRRVVNHQREILGEKHPDTLKTRSRLAASLRQQGRLTDAEHMYRDVSKHLHETLGDAHLETLLASSNLAECLAVSGKESEAIELMSHARQECVASHGLGHPTSIRLSQNLANLFDSVGDGRKAADTRKGRQKRNQTPHLQDRSHAAGLQIQCAYCRVGEPVDATGKFQKCSRCLVARYCSLHCQRQEWKSKHKQICAPAWKCETCGARGSTNTACCRAATSMQAGLRKEGRRQKPVPFDSLFSPGEEILHSWKCTFLDELSLCRVRSISSTGALAAQFLLSVYYGYRSPMGISSMSSCEMFDARRRP